MCTLFLGADKGQDLHFAALDRRIPLTHGTLVLFDTAQPHAIIARGRAGFDPADFPPHGDCTQLFLTWELPAEHASVRRALQIALDIDTGTAAQCDEAQVRVNGVPGRVCPTTGRWLDDPIGRTATPRVRRP